MSSRSSSSMSKDSATMKQAKLSFNSSRRTASAKATQKPKATSSLSPPQIAPTVINKGVDVTDIHITPEDDTVADGKSVKEGGHVPVSTLPSNKRKRMDSKVGKVPVAVLSSKGESQDRREHVLAELNDKDPRWRRHHAVVRGKMGHLPPIHAEGQSKVHEILRVFDMSYEYGPCIGMTRLERWERASALGLNPPDEVLQILSTRQGTEESAYSQSVLYDEV